MNSVGCTVDSTVVVAAAETSIAASGKSHPADSTIVDGSFC